MANRSTPARIALLAFALGNAAPAIAQSAPPLVQQINNGNWLNKDGSVDLWFGPAAPTEAPASNWIQTVSRR